jgi:predicted RND superfamily exporter protein
MNNWIIKYRLFIIIFSIAITLLSLSFLPKIEVNPNLDSYIPDDIENKIYLKQLDSIFGGNEIIIVMMQAEDVVNSATLERLKHTSEEIADLAGVKRCMSPFNAQNIFIEDGFMVMEPFFDSLPKTKKESDTLKSQIAGNQLASRFFADDFSVVSFIVIKEQSYSDKTLIDNIQTIINETPGDEEVLLGGLPYIRYSISGNIKKDIVYLLPMAIILMLFMLFISFREWKGVFIPLIIVTMSIALAFGLMALLGWQISLITILLPIMLIAIANNYGIHMIALYQELAQVHKDFSMLTICKKIYKDLKRPIIVTGLTTIGGILGLLTHTMIPAAQLGVLAAFGIGIALLLSIWFLPALLSYFKPKTNAIVFKNNKSPLLQRWLNTFSKIVTTHPKRVLVTTAILALLSMIGLFLVKVDTNIEGYFLGKSKISKSIQITNEKFGGSQFVSIMFTGDVLNPVLLRRMEAYEKELKQDPAVGTISSPVTLVKELSKGFYNEDEEGYNQIPTTADEVYQSIEMFAMGGNEKTVEQFIDYNY